MPLNDAVPSSARDVATRNMQDLDKFVNGEQLTNNNRLGAAIRSIAGIQNEANQAFGNIGYVPVAGSFESGGTVTARNEVLLYEADGYYYKWAGTLPKVVAPASTPATSGGVGAGFWSAVGGISTGFFAVLTGTLTAAQTTIATDKEGGDPGGALLPDDQKVFLRQNAKWTISGGLDAYVSDDYVLTIIGTPVGGETFTVEQNSDDEPVKYTNELGSSISISGYLDRQGIWAEDETGIQQANNYIVSTGKRDCINLPPRRVITISSGLSIDVSFVGIRGNGSELNSTITNGIAMGINPSSDIFNKAFEQNVISIRDFVLSGPGSSEANSILLDFNSAISNSSAGRITLANIFLKDAGILERFRAHSYLVNHQNVHMYSASLGSYIQQATDQGENINYFGGAIFNLGTAFSCENSGASVNLHGVSIDYVTKICDWDNGVLTMDGGHIEINTTVTDPITVNAGVVTLRPTRVLYAGEPLVNPPDYFAKVLSPASLYIDTFFTMGETSQKTLSNRFYNGDGHCQLINKSNDGRMPSILSTNSPANRLVQPFFNSLNREVFITDANGGAPTTNHTSTELTLTVIGNRLRATKNNSNTASFCIHCYANPYEIIGYEMQIYLNGTSYDYDVFYGKVVEGDINTVVARGASFDSGAGIVASQTEVSTINGSSNRVPEIRTHFIIEINCDALLATEYVELDLPYFTRLG